MRAGISNIKGNLYTGGWQLIYENLLTSAATSVTISGLDGNTDKEYKLVVRHIGGYDGGNSTIYLRPNNDSGANYGYQRLVGQDSTASALQGTANQFFLNINSGCALNELHLSEHLLYAKSGYVRTLVSKAAEKISGTTVNSICLIGQSWNNTADNITSLVILANQTNGMGIGTHILLFAKRIKQTTQLEGSLELYKGKLQAGVMQTIYETTLTEAATSITISGLDGNTDILYELECRFVSNFSGGASGIQLRFNNDSGTNYGQQYCYGNDSTAGAGRDTPVDGLQIGHCSSNGWSSFVNALYYVKSGYVRTGLINTINSIYATTNTTIVLRGDVWNNTADNITSLVIYGNTNVLGIGTYIRLKALRKVL